MPIQALPNELLIVIFDEVISGVKPHAAIHKTIVNLSLICHRFYEALQFHLDSVCLFAVSIPNAKIPEVSTRYRLLRFNTGGATGIFVKKLEVYGGIRTPSKAQFKPGDEAWSLAHFFATFKKGLEAPGADATFGLFQYSLNATVPGFTNLSSAFLQNSTDGLVVHLIYALRVVLVFCPSLRNLRLLVTLSLETQQQLAALLKVLEDSPTNTSARLQELEVSIREKRYDENIPHKDEKLPCCGIELFSRLLGPATESVRQFEFRYNDGNIVRYRDGTPETRWRFSNLRHIKMPSTSLTTRWAIDSYLDVDYTKVETLTLTGQASENMMSWDEQTIKFFTKFSDVKTLSISISSKEDTKWVLFLLVQKPPDIFPRLEACELHVSYDSYIIGNDRDAMSRVITNMRSNHRTEIIESTKKYDRFKFYLK
ncbi:hypothetical protein TWF694_009284 [Orbilia ellipsospora]|uniref:F-box domain-containing protein n=1 Tax=Orbilia ellipsospora TaxID=2528407 RepID=A0AAV9XH73_9PEZI